MHMDEVTLINKNDPMHFIKKLKAMITVNGHAYFVQGETQDNRWPIITIVAPSGLQFGMPSTCKVDGIASFRICVRILEEMAQKGDDTKDNVVARRRSLTEAWENGDDLDLFGK
eukprot:TRINITY_DN57320_c0_g1_i1.p2 TRINITY_DN57320_c0_g1~~TRINITY_DN57320_c0_g1_i1.p2  ORF type:complete len:114 (-),score=22.67 TRINITY_DN57320_c0_g1_i1:173-514(-)